METLTERLRELLEAASADPGFLEYLLLGLGALLEYVFPPFPGDAVVLLGAFLVGRYDWSLPAVWTAVCLGSLAGLSMDYAFGVWVRRRDASWRVKYATWGRLGQSIDRFDVFYRRWGALCIAFNRFVPALRAVFFVAAGMAGIRFWKVAVLGLLSAVAWNLLLFFAGVSVGNNWDRLKDFLRTYSMVAWIVGAVVVAILLLRWALRRRGKGSGPTSAPLP